MTADNKVKHGEMCLALSDTHDGGVVRLHRCTQHDLQQVCFTVTTNANIFNTISQDYHTGQLLCIR